MVLTEGRITRRATVAALVGAVLMGPSLASAAESRYHCEPQPLARIPPGTRVADRAPDGWTHLVFKTYNRLATGEVNALPEFARSMAQFLFTVMAARVTPVGNGLGRVYRLERVAIGVGTRIGAHDTVISSETQQQLGANLGVFKGVVLSKAEEHLNQVRQIAASDAMMVVDAPTVLFDRKENRTVVFRYLFLMERTSGGLASVVWQIDRDAGGAYRGVVGKAVLVEPSLVATSPIHVDGTKINFGIPGPEAFGITKLPPGESFSLPAAVRQLAGQPGFTAETAAKLESEIRRALDALASR